MSKANRARKDIASAPPQPDLNAWPGRLAWALAVLVAVSPLWAGHELPLVDLPQHFYVIAILNHLHDPANLFARFFEPRPGFSPYIAYYYLVGHLARVVSVETANRVFLSVYVAGLPLSMGFLIRSLGRPAWPALLAIPLAYGDNFAMGFVNYCAALPLTFVCMGLFVRAITDSPRRPLWGASLAAALLALLAVHPVPLAFLALALPFLLLTTRAPEELAAFDPIQWLRVRRFAIGGVLPAVLVALLWLRSLAGHPTPIAYGVPWHAWGPIFSKQNVQFMTFGENLAAFPQLLAGILSDDSDRLGLRFAGVIAGLAIIARVFSRASAPAHGGRWHERARPAGLVAIAVGLYFTLPLNIQGYVGGINPRFAQLAALLSLSLLPRLGPGLARTMLWLAAVAALATAAPLIRGFEAFDREAASLRAMVRASGDRPRVMGLIYDDYSRVVRFPVYLHSAATLARERGGIPNYSLGGWPSAPIRFRATPPPTYPSEWEPRAFDYEAQGGFYDHFLVRGANPLRIFGKRIGDELEIAAHDGDFWLVRRRR